MDQSDASDEPPLPARLVHIMMLPVKDMGLARRVLIRMLAYTLGSFAAIGWGMHWVILAEDTSFELQRFPERPYTRLKSSKWDESRRPEVFHEMEVGRTRWENLDIEDLGQCLD